MVMNLLIRIHAVPHCSGAPAQLQIPEGPMQLMQGCTGERGVCSCPLAVREVRPRITSHAQAARSYSAGHDHQPTA